MIDKYAEIRDRILLYNACKGILRVKQADLASMAPKAWAQVPDALKPTLTGAYNGAQSVGNFVKANPISSTVGGVGGYIYGGRWGHNLAGWLAKKLGLDPNKKGLRGGIGRFIQGTGRWGGRIGGGILGAIALSNIVNGFNGKMADIKAANPTPTVPSTDTTAAADQLAKSMMNPMSPTAMAMRGGM